jgi:signal transduction histidine kinase
VSNTIAQLRGISFPALRFDPHGTVTGATPAFSELFDVDLSEAVSIVAVLDGILRDPPGWTGTLADPPRFFATVSRTVRCVETVQHGPAYLEVGRFTPSDFILVIGGIAAPGSVVPPSILSTTPRLVATLLDAAGAGTFVLDNEERIIDFNDLSVQYTGVPEELSADLVGSPIDSVVSVYRGSDRLSVAELVRRASESGERLSLGAEIRISPGGVDSQEAEVTVLPVAGDHGETEAAAVVTIEPVVDRRRVDRDLRNQQHADDIARAAISIAHDLNDNATTMTAVLDRIALYRSDEDEDTPEEDERLLQSALRRIRRLAAQLERFSYRESRDEDEEDQVVTPERVLDIIHDTVFLATGGTAVRTTFSLDSIPALRFSASDLTQALFNVVLNATEAMSEEGTLRIELHYDDGTDFVRLAVRDDGTGMNPRMIDHAFRPYYSTKPHKIGLGLTVALSILESGGGGLDLETEPGFGTTVIFSLPVAGGVGRAARNDRPERGNPREKLSECRVLLVEDDPLVRRSMEIMIRALGCEIVSVNTGERAVDVYQREIQEGRGFTVLVTDLAMPGRVNGVQLLRRLREYSPDLPAILSSGALHRDNAEGYREAGFQYVLRKPFGENALREALSTALQR